MRNAAEKAVDRLEELERNTVVIKFSFDPKAAPESRQHNSLVEEYVNAHAQAIKSDNTDSPAFGSFNEYLQEHPLFKTNPKYQGKVIVAEISGTLSSYEDDNGDRNYGGINLEGGDFTGGRFTNIDISTSLKGVSFRDCYFEEVLLKSSITGVDFRGSKIKNCTFFDYSSDNPARVKGLRFSFYDAQSVQKLGLFSIRDNQDIATEQQAYEEKAIQKRDKLIRALNHKIAELKKGKGVVDWAANLVMADAYNRRTNLRIEKVKAQISKIEEEHISNLKLKFEEIANTRFINLKNVQLDPTYIPNQSHELANQEKVSIKATRKDLVAYLTTDRHTSFKEFVLGLDSNKNAVSAQQEQNQDTVFVIDLSRQDISGLDLSDCVLSGINFAYTDATGTKFKNSNLTGTCFEGATIAGASFEKADLTDANCIGALGQGKTVNFNGAILIRAQMQYSQLPRVKMESAILYSADFTGSNVEHAIMIRADARKSDFEKANLRSVDARYVKMRKSNLSKAIIEDSNLFKANLDEAIMTHTQAVRANLEEAVMNDVTAHHANFMKAVMNRVTAKGADFSDADFEEVYAQFANLEGATMHRVNAVASDFSDAIMTDLKAHNADFRHAVFARIEGERLDIRGSILHNADFHESNLERSIMERVQAERADFTKAILIDANLRFSNMKKASFEHAKMMGADISGMDATAANFEGANVTGIIYDSKTMLFDANLRNVIGGEALKELQKLQHEARNQLFGESRYGSCVSNKDGSNDRFQCQRLGAVVLSAAIGGSAGFTLAGPLGGLSATVVTGMIADKSLERIRDNYYGDLGYLNNSIGDRLAEIGVIAQSLGINAADKAIDGAAAGLICSSVGFMRNLGTAAIGVGVSYAGLRLLHSGINQNSRLQKYAGGGLAGVGIAAATVGGGALAAAPGAVAYGAVAGAAFGASQGVYNAYRDLLNYDEDKETGKRPEQIYRENLDLAQRIWTKVVPTSTKLLSGVLLASAFLVTTCLTGALVLGTSVMAIALIFEVATVTTTAGFTLGYLYGDKIPLLNRLHTRAELQQSKEVAEKIDQCIGINPVEKSETNLPASTANAMLL